MNSKKYPEDNDEDEAYFYSNELFDALYPMSLQQHAARHWTPLQKILDAAAFLGADPGSKVLDIGAGAGKFCLVAAHHYPECYFYGIEQRAGLVRVAGTMRQKLGLENTTFFHGDFTEIDFSNFDHFYFYNSFFEQIAEKDEVMDESIAYSKERFELFERQLFHLLDQRPAGTKLVTYYTADMRLPESYQLISSEHRHTLQFWQKMQ